MKLLVEGEISATSYKKLNSRLKGLSKTHLWKVLDHFIFHELNDEQVERLFKHLDEGVLQENKQEATASAEDDDFFYTVDPRERFRAQIINTLPTTEALSAIKDRLYLYYDEHCFDNYIDNEIRADFAKKLVDFASNEGLPIEDHWIDYSLD